MPLHRHDRRLRPLPPGPSPRLRRGTATSLARSVLVVPPDLDGFLRRAAIRRSRPRRPAGLLHPAAGHGVRQVSDSCTAFGRLRTWSVRFLEAFPTGEDPSKLSSSPVAVPLVTAALPKESLLAKGWPRSPRGVPSRRWTGAARSVSPRLVRRVPDLRAFIHRRVRCRFADVAAVARLDAPMGFGSTCSDACRASLLEVAPAALRADRSTPAAPNRRGVHRHPRVVRKASARLVWLREGRCWSRPEGRRPRRSGSLAARRLLRFQSA